MRLAVNRDGAYNEPAAAQLMVSHPNHSGLAMDQLTRLYTPAYFVRSVKVSYAGKTVFAAEVDFSISENPYFRFYFVPYAAGELKAEVVDTKLHLTDKSAGGETVAGNVVKKGKGAVLHDIEIRSPGHHVDEFAPEVKDSR